jgi:hypothetical protein
MAAPTDSIKINALTDGVTAVATDQIPVNRAGADAYVTPGYIQTMISVAAVFQPKDATLTALAAYNTNGILTQTAADTFTAITITGTANKITVTNGDGVAGNPTLTISATYVGQTSITTLGTITTGVWTGTTIALANGGSGAVSAAAARVSFGLNVWHAVADADYTVLATDLDVGYTSISAARVITLPAASAVNAGQVLVIGDVSGSASATNTITITRAGADTINGATTYVIKSANGLARLISDGASKWYFDIVGTARGGTGVNNAGTLTNASNTTITGGGTLALGGFTLTVPATGSAALLATANVFTAVQTVNLASNTQQLIVKANATQSVNMVEFRDSTAAPISGIGGDGLEIFTRRYIALDNSSGTHKWALTCVSGTDFDVSETGVAVARIRIIPGGSVGLGIAAPLARLHVLQGTTTANAIKEVVRIDANVTTGGTGSSAGFGPQLTFFGESATDTTQRQMADWSVPWVVATDVSRTARIVGNVWDTAAREWIRGEASGSAAMVGFLGAAAVVRQTSAALTNNVVASGTTDQFDDFTSLTVYASDAAAIHADIYQLARKMKIHDDALRLFGFLT